MGIFVLCIFFVAVYFLTINNINLLRILLIIFKNFSFFQTMSYDPLGISDAMLDSLSLQLREAEVRRAEAERAHQVYVIFFFIYYP